MQASPLELETYYLESLKWSLSSSFDASEDEVRLALSAEEIECDVQRADLEAPRYAAYRLQLSSKSLEGKPQPYDWEIVLVGYFRLHDTVPDDRVIALMDGNAPAVLFGAAREAIATALSRGPFRAPMLPGVNFMNLQRNDAKAALVAAKKEAKASKTLKTPTKKRAAKQKS